MQLDAHQIANCLSNRDASELKLVDWCLRTNEACGHDREAVAHLIAMELARANGMAVRITELGYEVLRHL